MATGLISSGGITFVNTRAQHDPMPDSYSRICVRTGGSGWTLDSDDFPVYFRKQLAPETGAVSGLISLSDLPAVTSGASILAAMRVGLACFSCFLRRLQERRAATRLECVKKSSQADRT